MAERCNELTGKEWLQNSISIWSGIARTPEEKKQGHPAAFPAALADRVIRSLSRPGIRVLDPFNGAGAMTYAASQIGDSAVGIDLSPEYCEIAERKTPDDPNIIVRCGDACELLKEYDDASFDLCMTSPPYWDILNQKHTADFKESRNYSDKDIDLGNIPDYDVFLEKLGDVFREVHRILIPGGYCVVVVMDLRKKSTFYALHLDMVTLMRNLGFEFDDLWIWDRRTEYNNFRPLGYPYRFRINKAHEYVLVFRAAQD